MPKPGFISHGVTKTVAHPAEREPRFLAGWLEGGGCSASTRTACYRSVAQAVTVSALILPSVLSFIESPCVKICTFTGASYLFHFTVFSCLYILLCLFLPWNNVVVCWSAVSNLTAGYSLVFGLIIAFRQCMAQSY